ncbi:hypothetical protein ALQ26_03293 [Pseudomonas amygdali pv. lachrymans]|nr:hypothetical protein ALQ26_03293 [Pseudomonas amygdali pv. lachrymans]
MRRAQQAQPQKTHGAGSRTVGIEITDNQHTLTFAQRRYQQIYRSIDSLELLIRDQPRQAFVQLGLAGHAPCSIKTSEQGR